MRVCEEIVDSYGAQNLKVNTGGLASVLVVDSAVEAEVGRHVLLDR